MEYSYNDFRCYSELYHHGILGQEWGKKHGPPYPLDRQTHNRVVRGDASNYKKSKTKPPDKRTSGKTRTYGNDNYNPLQLGMAEIDKFLANHGKRKLTGFGNDTYDHDRAWQAVEERILDNGKSTYVNVAKALSKDDSLYRKPLYEISSENISKLKEDARQVNPGRYDYYDGGTRDNCPMCTASFELRMRGYNVSAARSDMGANSAAHEYWFDNADAKYNVSHSYANRAFRNMKPGSSGAIAFSFGHGYGHVMNWVKTTDNKLFFIDSQNEMTFPSLNTLGSTYKIDYSKKFDIIDYTNATPNFSHMSKDSVISSSENDSRVKYRNKYNGKIVDTY